jgi:hypothetical protein
MSKEKEVAMKEWIRKYCNEKEEIEDLEWMQYETSIETLAIRIAQATFNPEAHW